MQQDQEGVDKAVGNALVMVQNLRAEVVGDKLFSYLEECGLSVKPAFLDAFKEVESLLRT